MILLKTSREQYDASYRSPVGPYLKMSVGIQMYTKRNNDFVDYKKELRKTPGKRILDYLEKNWFDLRKWLSEYDITAIRECWRESLRTVGVDHISGAIVSKVRHHPLRMVC
ncbi:hypothetical protein TNCV_3640431 [Trichonephila clavipes]|nr:hypothetical protein TNCV_3640431 [Trichonephila clavipes]